MLLRLNPAVRITPPSRLVDGQADDQWLADNLLERRRFKISRRAAAALVASCRPQDPDDLVKRLMDAAGDGNSADHWEDLIGSLRDRDLIIDATLADSDSRLRWLVGLRRSWSRFGWHEAAEYHTLSFDYPCIDYSEATAFIIDQTRMRGYQADEPDTDRFKLDYLGQPGIALPEPAADMSPVSARSLWVGSAPPEIVDLPALSTVISLSFGAIGSLVPRTRSAPLLRRSSPSGGGRNPSEGYVIIRAVPGIEPGWYHITMRPFSLRKLDGLRTDEESIWRLFPETIERFPLTSKALVVITSMFERNMYRYREPRTFRTVHMDAGHIAGSLRIAARSVGLTAGIYYCDAATRIEETLGIDGMREGYMLTVAIADGVAGPGRQSDPA
jgi:SagB-type dehydrogenase family enzyme